MPNRAATTWPPTPSPSPKAGPSHGGDIADDLLRERDRLVAYAYRHGTDAEELTAWRWSA